MQDAPPPAPRPFKIKSLPVFVLVMSIVSAVLTFNGILVATIFTLIGGPFWHDIALDKRGIEAEATPTKVEPTSSTVNGARVYEIYYTYANAEGAQQQGMISTYDNYTIEFARSGDKMTIEYDPQEPKVSRKKGEQASIFGLFTLIPLASVLVGIGAFLFVLPRARRIRNLYINGTPVMAKVTAVEATLASVNGRTVMRVSYEFDSVRGPVNGSASSTEAPSLGAQIWILHDPTEPGDNVAA